MTSKVHRSTHVLLNCHIGWHPASDCMPRMDRLLDLRNGLARVKTLGADLQAEIRAVSDFAKHEKIWVWLQMLHNYAHISSMGGQQCRTRHQNDTCKWANFNCKEKLWLLSIYLPWHSS